MRKPSCTAVPDYRGERLDRDLRRGRAARRRRGRMVRRRATTSSSPAPPSFAVTRDAASPCAIIRRCSTVAGDRTSEAEARRGVRWLLKMYDQRRDGSSTTRWGSAAGKRGSSATTTCGASRRRTTRGRSTLAGTSLTVRRSGSARPVRRSRRRSPAGWRRLRALCAQLWAGTPLAGQCLHEGQVCSRWPRRTTSTADRPRHPSATTARTSGATISRSARRELYLGLLAPGAPAPAPPASPPRFYLRQAARWADAYLRSPLNGGDTFNLYDIAGLAHPELHRAIAADGGAGLKVTPADLLRDLRGQLDPR